ncbi:MobF family relaxase [Subtercola vilae]|uniref:TraA-like conjugal transfer protein n=1 Tax=Subtercola vilae TaxID=2056433 RepID=A0A4T2BD30_9MICO|nr:MobF family relaxase [Subtercola vilae]TIH28449.1 TraA-like conjugal transfer protein [Subtercola vilae]
MMTVHVLHAGNGYTYLTRQVAAGDQTRARGEDLTAYYTAEGNPPGVWVGNGLTSLGVEGQVSERQMLALFGEGLHPDADRIVAENVGAGMPAADAIQAARLGRRFMTTEQTDDGWDAAIAAAYDTFRTEAGRNPEVGVERDLLRWGVASEALQGSLDRAPTDAEVSGFLAKKGKAARQPVAGYDLVFTPVKSVSVLWALGDAHTSAEVHAAHTAAWSSTVSWLEKEAALTRVGAGGAAQLNTKGLVATAFEHRDSRTGDPNLHTHVAVSTKVQGEDGKWRSLDGRVLHALGVSASERYNTLIEKELRDRLGVTFTDEVRGRNKRPVREIDGVPKQLRDSFSSRRAAIEDAYEELLTAYVASHGHTPARAAQISMAQEATLSTRQAKAKPESLTELRAGWRAAAATVIGERGVALLSVNVTRPRELTAAEEELAARTVPELSAGILATVENSRSTWRMSHLQAEALRVARAYGNIVRTTDVEQLTVALTDTAVQLSVGLRAPELNPVPAVMRRTDGTSIYEVHDTTRFTSTHILKVEDDLVAAASTRAGFVASEDALRETVAKTNAASRFPLDASQVELARRFATGGHRIEVGVGPAGTGKTTTMRLFARTVTADGGRVLALAPTAVASTVLAKDIGVPADTAHKLIDVHKNGTAEQKLDDKYRIDENTILLVDEAGMASTPLLEELLQLAVKHGAAVRLLGDPAQLAAVESGGALRLIQNRAGASYLDEVHRFASKEEAAASLKLRVGDSTGLGFYIEEDRTRGGLRQSMLEEIYDGWARDRAAGKQSIMVAGINDEVAALNAQARLDLIGQGAVKARGVILHDGNKAGAGDIVVTRQNERRLNANRGKDFVANGDLWQVLSVHHGELKVKHLRHGGVLTLPAEYVSTDVELGYAATINRVQGMTVDTSHILIDPEATAREQLYVAATRGRESNRMYTVIDDVLEVDLHAPDTLRNSIHDGLVKVLAREGAEYSAHEQLQQILEHSESLAALVPRYEDARTRILDPGLLPRMEQTLRTVLHDAAVEQIIDDAAWTHLAHRMGDLEVARVDVTERLTAAAANPQGDDGVRSLAKVYHHRLGEGIAEPAPSGLPGWLTLPPVGARAETEVGRWIIDQGELITARVDQLYDQAHTAPEPWLGALRPEPTPGAGDDVWARNVRTVLAYRDQEQIRTPRDPLGPQRHTDAYRHAAAALKQLQPSQSAALQERLAKLQLTRPTADQQPAPAEPRTVQNLTTEATVPYDSDPAQAPRRGPRI